MFDLKSFLDKPVPTRSIFRVEFGHNPVNRPEDSLPRIFLSPIVLGIDKVFNGSKILVPNPVPFGKVPACRRIVFFISDVGRGYHSKRRIGFKSARNKGREHYVLEVQTVANIKKKYEIAGQIWEPRAPGTYFTRVCSY